MSYIQEKIDTLKIKIREELNPYLGKRRVAKLKNSRFTIISNNCWAGHVYRYYNLPYDSPTIGLFIYSEDYIKFIYNLRHYMKSEIKFISYTESKYREQIIKAHKENIPIGLIDDVEIFFLHYHSEEEARKKWNRRKERIHWDNLYFKMSEQNLCTPELLQKFDQFSSVNKFVFVSKDYGLNSQIVFKDWLDQCEVPNDTTNFRRYINVTKWLNHEPFKLKQ